MTGCYIIGASVFGPGLASWQAARPVFRGEAALTDDVKPPPAPALLAPNERRRAGVPARLAFAVCEEATRMSGIAAASMAGVFASANGEGSVVHGLLENLAGADRQLSPTAFHNSVHNAVAGYWTIGAGSLQPMTCIACQDWSFAAGLMQAYASCLVPAQAVLFCAYDAPVPHPLGAGRPVCAPFAAAFVLAPEPAGQALGRLTVRFEADAASHDGALPRAPALQALAGCSAAARSLRLLEALAAGTADMFALPLPDGHAACAVLPC